MNRSADLIAVQGINFDLGEALIETTRRKTHELVRRNEQRFQSASVRFRREGGTHPSYICAITIEMAHLQPVRAEGKAANAYDALTVAHRSVARQFEVEKGKRHDRQAESARRLPAHLRRALTPTDGGTPRHPILRARGDLANLPAAAE